MDTVTDPQFQIDTTAYEKAEGKAPSANKKGTWLFSLPAGNRSKRPLRFVDMRYGKAAKDLEAAARNYIGVGTYRLDEWK